jgi:hypothetical protein
MKNIAILLLIIITMPSFACRPNLNHVNFTMDNASNIYVGHVTGIHNVTYENQLKENDEKLDVIVFGSEEILMRIYVTKTLKGKKEQVIFANGPFCSFSHNIRDKVYVFTHKDRKQPFSINEQSLKEMNLKLYKKLQLDARL